MTDRPFDPGLQPERTLLSWRRTCLALAVASLVSVRFAAEILGVAAIAFGVVGLVMAIAGGAVLPMVHGAALDAFGPAPAFLVPAACFAVGALYGLFDLVSTRRLRGQQI